MATNRTTMARAPVVVSSADDMAIAPDFSYKSTDEAVRDDSVQKMTLDRAIGGASVDNDRRANTGRAGNKAGQGRRGSNDDGVCDDEDRKDESCEDSPRGSGKRRSDNKKGRHNKDSSPATSSSDDSDYHRNKHNSPRKNRPSGGGGGHEADIPENAEPSEVLGLGAVVPKGMAWNVPTEVCVGDKYVIIGRCPTGAKPVSIDLWAPYPKDKAISVKMFMSLRRFQISAKCDGKPKACTCPAKDEAYPFEKDREFKIIIAVTKDCYVVKFYGTKGQGHGSMKHVIPLDEIDTFSISNTEMIFKALKYC